MIELYNPLTYQNLMVGLATYFQGIQTGPMGDALAQTPVVNGPGVYAIYYRGNLDFYQPISDGREPIYVGKAVPPGARKGRTPNTGAAALHARLREHAKSIDEADNLSIEEFQFRCLPVEPVWITLAERFLIDRHQPVWNLSVDGFGKHDSGTARRGGERSWWDTLHPGRAWAMQESSSRSQEEAQSRVRQFFAMPANIESIISEYNGPAHS